MIIYKCDFCGKNKQCEHVEFEGRTYDICKSCHADLKKRLRGKGRYKEPSIIPYVPYVPCPYPHPRPFEPWTITWTSTTDSPMTETLTVDDNYQLFIG